MKRSLILSLGALLMIGGFVVRNVSAFNVFGADDRKRMEPPTGVYRAIGLIESDLGDGIEQCTGTLVGRDLVLTNFHCVGDVIAHQLPLGRIEFKAVRTRARWSFRSEVIGVVARYTNTPDGVSYSRYRDDWAILRLKKPLGDELGWFDVADRAPTRSGAAIQFAGYHGDIAENEALTVQTNCTLRGLHPVRRTVMHDCDSTPGASGSPVFQLVPNARPRIVALHAGHTANQNTPEGGWIQASDFSVRYANWAMDPLHFAAVVRDERAKSR